MSTAAPAARLGWRLLPAVAAGAAMVIAASLALTAMKSADAPLVARGPDRAAGAPVAVAASPWDMRVFPVGQRGPLSKAQRKSFKKQRPHVTNIVRRFNAALVSGHAIGHVARTHFTPEAARAFVRADPAMPRDATGIEISKRKAWIGLQAKDPTTAAARLEVRAKAVRDEGRSIAWRYQATLWMEKSRNGWRVIAFDLHRRPR